MPGRYSDSRLSVHPLSEQRIKQENHFVTLPQCLPKSPILSCQRIIISIAAKSCDRRISPRSLYPTLFAKNAVKPKTAAYGRIAVIPFKIKQTSPPMMGIEPDDLDSLAAAKSDLNYMSVAGCTFSAAGAILTLLERTIYLSALSWGSIILLSLGLILGILSFFSDKYYLNWMAVVGFGIIAALFILDLL